VTHASREERGREQKACTSLRPLSPTFFVRSARRIRLATEIGDEMRTRSDSLHSRALSHASPAVSLSELRPPSHGASTPPPLPYRYLSS